MNAAHRVLVIKELLCRIGDYNTDNGNKFITTGRSMVNRMTNLCFKSFSLALVVDHNRADALPVLCRCGLYEKIYGKITVLKKSYFNSDEIMLMVMMIAAAKKKLNMVKSAYALLKKKCTIRTINQAVLAGDRETIAWAYDNRNPECNTGLPRLGKPLTRDYILSNCPLEILYIDNPCNCGDKYPIIIGMMLRYKC